VNWDYACGTGAEAPLDALCCEVLSLLVDIDEARHRPEHRYGLCGSDERVRGQDDLAARRHPQGLEAEDEGVGARRETHGISRAAERGELMLERLYLFP
jgi:hypothetical protein